MSVFDHALARFRSFVSMKTVNDGDTGKSFGVGMIQRPALGVGDVAHYWLDMQQVNTKSFAGQGTVPLHNPPRALSPLVDAPQVMTVTSYGTINPKSIGGRPLIKTPSFADTTNDGSYN